MPSMAEIRQQYPQYSDIDDATLARGLHSKFYADMPFEDFAAKIGYGKAVPKEEPYQGSILPFSKDENGNVAFDKDAGALAFTGLPNAVYEGRKSPMGPEGIADRLGFAAAITPMGAALRAAPRLKLQPKVPTAEELKGAADKQYAAAGNSGVEYKASSIDALAKDIQSQLWEKAKIAENNPKTYNLLGKLQGAPKDAVMQLKYLDAMRQELGHVAGSPDEAMAASIAIKNIDRFLADADPSSVVARTPPPTGTTAPVTAGHDFGPGDTSFSQGAARDAAMDLKDAQGNWGAYKRSQKIQGIEDRADLRAAASNSGQNLDNTIRQRFASILAQGTGELGSGKLARGFTDEELGKIADVAEGTPTRNAARYVGNLLGKGGGMGQTVATILAAMGGAAAGGGEGAVIAGAVPGVIGVSANKLAEGLARKSVRTLDESTRMRSPLYAERAANPETRAPNIPTKAAALARALALMKATDEQDFKNRGGI